MKLSDISIIVHVLIVLSNSNVIFIQNEKKARVGGFKLVLVR